MNDYKLRFICVHPNKKEWVVVTRQITEINISCAINKTAEKLMESGFRNLECTFVEKEN